MGDVFKSVTGGGGSTQSNPQTGQSNYVQNSNTNQLGSLIPPVWSAQQQLANSFNQYNSGITSGMWQPLSSYHYKEALKLIIDDVLFENGVPETVSNRMKISQVMMNASTLTHMDNWEEVMKACSILIKHGLI